MDEMVEAVDLPAGGQEFWARQRDPELPTAVVQHPDLATGAIHDIVTGRVPAGTSNDVSGMD